MHRESVAYSPPRFGMPHRRHPGIARHCGVIRNFTFTRVRMEMVPGEIEEESGAAIADSAKAIRLFASPA